jgi:hypothetical protein
MSKELTDGNGTALAGTSGGASPYVLSFEIIRRWAGLPDSTLRFKLRMYLSGELTQAREGTLGLDHNERLKALLDFRTRVLADVLLAPPEGFPDFPAEVELGEGTSTKLKDRAYVFFSRKDEEGFSIFALLVEDVVNEYWLRALPSPTLPASAS